MTIRVNVAAAIVQDGKILAIEYNDETGLHYNLPGGGVEEGETLAEAVRREVREEAGVEIFVGALLLEWEYVPERHNNRYGTQHKVGLIYEATTLEEPDPNHRYDDHQTGVRWLPLSQLLTAETINYFGKDLLSAIHARHRLRGDIDLRRHSTFTPVGTPSAPNRQYTFNIFTDLHVFVISAFNFPENEDQMQDFIGGIYETHDEYLYEGLDDKLYCADGRLFVGTERNLTAPVVIDILSQKPTPETLDTLISTASQVGICGFEATTPAIVVQSMMFTHDYEGLMEIEPGTYEVMIFYNDMDKQRDNTTGDDWYHIVFYPGEMVKTKLIKTYIYTPKKH